ncbi:hypothetical protein L3Q82_017391 [Scortum barcoo]|uniref:Uncharacterized protein n=1 Tax=Scortum barcoo TaxID=214431 RepID=A0ACB8VKS3_9TELE|nr:hypothetical protein L3Q82_017391 [Scortum barcoo]
MEHTLIRYADLSEQAFVSINSPLNFLNLAANIFFACCLVLQPCGRQRLKQPVKTLLGSLVWCSVLCSVSLTSTYWLSKESSFKMFAVSYAISLYYVYNSMTCSVWLNFYYYIQIVPSQRALLIWVKRNIRSVISVALALDAMLFALSCAVVLAEMLMFSGFTHVNGTWTVDRFDDLFITGQACLFAIRIYMFICLCVMMVSSFSTVHYLHRHIQSVVHGGSSFSTLRIQSQMRVTITGISQGVLYFLCTAYYFLDSGLSYFSQHFVFSVWINFTVTSLYISGTTINLGIGQATFRQRIVNMWKALRALAGIGVVTHDMTKHSIHLTSGEIANLECLTGLICLRTTREEDAKRETANRIKMNYLTHVLINGPLVILNILANAFYTFCMVRPLHGGRIKQPLKLLLASLIFSTITYMVSMPVLLFSRRQVENDALLHLSNVMFMGSLSTTLTSSVWLNFFYWTQIVPAQRAPFIWIKRNIKPIIYWIWVVEKIAIMFNFTVFLDSADRFGFSSNDTVDHDMLPPASALSERLVGIEIILVFLRKAHFFVCLCVMVMSSSSTVVYLSRHMRRMIANGQSTSCPQFRGQVRVTVTGILQGVLYSFCWAVWTVYSFTEKTSPTSCTSLIIFTTINLYMSGNTVSLGAGQSVFRQRAADVWLRAAQCCNSQSKEGDTEDRTRRPASDLTKT